MVKKSTGGNGDDPHPSQFPDPPPNLFLSNNNDEDKYGDDDDKNGRDGNFGRNMEREDSLGSGRTAPVKYSTSAFSSD